MKANYLSDRDLFYIVPASLLLGAFFTSIQEGNWVLGFFSFTLVFLVSIVLLKMSYSWSGAKKTLGIIIALAFFLYLAVGVTLHLALPVYGHSDEDDRAGYVFTDAHKRDKQAWSLATSERPVIDAFSSKYASDQYGGLLAFNSLVYRYLSSDAQRPLMLVVFSAFFAALGIPFLWKSVRQIFEERIAWASAWIFALFPESILLSASAMREPYLLTFSAFALWGFVEWQYRTVRPETFGERIRNGWIWFGLGLLGMLLVSPVVALVTIVIFGGWVFFTGEGREISWKGILAVVVVFLLGLFLLSSSLNRSSQFEATSPLHVINDWLRLAVKWDAYQLERDSGWVQKIFDEGPRWIRLPFIAIYGLAQPVLPAAVIRPNKLMWTILQFLRGLGWYMILPLLMLSFVAAAGQASRKTRNLILWLSLLVILWALLAAIRGGADLWDNPRYRTILFMWQAVLAGYVWVWWRETRNAWLPRVVLMEMLFLLVFMQWYASRYYHWGGQLPFPVMIALILGLWGLVLSIGWWQDRKSAVKTAEKRA
ncbi:MAG TPA: hypothetical protein VFY66_19550 [Anaerolineales bacterium]|nr:hypothetical protein [Anaerolineales bacterium]